MSSSTQEGRAGNAIAEALDYVIAGQLSTRLNTPTKYKGIGRPRQSDYAEYEHPFDKKITKHINY